MNARRTDEVAIETHQGNDLQGDPVPGQVTDGRTQVQDTPRPWALDSGTFETFHDGAGI